MCIHMHHSDTHLDQVSYSMGVLRAFVIAISLLICCHCNQVACFYHAGSLVNFFFFFFFFFFFLNPCLWSSGLRPMVDLTCVCVYVP